MPKDYKTTPKEKLPTLPHIKDKNFRNKIQELIEVFREEEKSMRRKLILIIIFLLISNMCYSEDYDKYKLLIKGLCNKFTDEDIKVRIDVRKKLWNLVEKDYKEVMLLLIEELDNKDPILYLEALLFELTEYNCYGICIGNKEGINEWRKWWAKYKEKFMPHPDGIGYYYYYYVNERNFASNIGVYFYKTV